MRYNERLPVVFSGRARLAAALPRFQVTSLGVRDLGVRVSGDLIRGCGFPRGRATLRSREPSRAAQVVRNPDP